MGDADISGIVGGRAFLYSNGILTNMNTLISPTSGWTLNQGTAINDSGQVVGQGRNANSQNHAFLYSSGTITDLGTLGGSYSVPSAINTGGQVVGWADTAGNAGLRGFFLYSNGTMKDLGTLGGSWSTAYDITAGGRVMGHTILWEMPPPTLSSTSMGR